MSTRMAWILGRRASGQPGTGIQRQQSWNLSDDEIDDIASQIGSEWKQLALHLDFAVAQIDHLQELFRQPVERNRNMLTCWNSVVTQHDENARCLLAAAFSGIGNNLIAKKIVSDEELKDLQTKQAKEDTKASIKAFLVEELYEFQVEKVKLIVEKWLEEDKWFVETKACNYIDSKIMKEQIITVTGNSGSGKSAIARHIAIKLKQKEGYTIIPILSIDQIKRYSKNTQLKRVLIWDDPVGFEGVVDSKLNEFVSSNDQLLNLIKRANVKLIFTCRKQVVQERKFKDADTIIQKNIVDLQDSEIALSASEKVEILQKYTGKFTDTKWITAESSEVSNFPLICRVFSQNEKYQEQGDSFLKKPMSVIVAEFEKLKINDKLKYCALIICLIFDNRFDEGLLSNSGVEEAKIRQQMLLCDVPRTITFLELKCAMQSLVDVYLKKEGTKYSIHETFYDALSHSFGQDCPEKLIQHCTFSFIREYIKFEPADSTDNSCTVLGAASYRALSERIVNEIEKGNFHDVFFYSAFDHESFLLNFVSFLGTLDYKRLSRLFFDVDINKEQVTENISKSVLVQSMLAVKQTKCIHWSLAFGLLPLVEFCITKLGSDLRKRANLRLLPMALFGGNAVIVRRLMETKYSGTFADVWYYRNMSTLHMAVLSGCEEIVDITMENVSDANVVNEMKRTPLFFAAGLGNYKICHKLLLLGASAKLCDENGESPLYNAARNGHVDIATLLLQHGADIKLCNNYGISPMHIAAEKGHHKAVECLLRYGANVLACDFNGETPLITASYNGHARTVELLLKNGADVNHKNFDGWSSLFAAARGGNEETAGLLLKAQAKVNDCDFLGESPLYCAAEREHTHILRMLVEHEADVNHSTKVGWTPTLIVARNGFTETLEVLLKHGADVYQSTNYGWSPLHISALNNHAETVETLLHHGVDINKGNAKGETALHITAKNGMTDILKILLQQNADVNSRRNDGWSSLHIAAANGLTDTAEILLGHKPLVNVYTTNDESPLYIAAKYRHADIVQMLLQEEADVNHCTIEGCFPLRIACYNNDNYISESLLRHQALVNQRQNTGLSPLHFAAINGNIELVQMLLEHDANVNKQDANGVIALFVAAKNAHYKVVEMLLNNGAEINVCSYDGWSPLHAAVYSGNSQIVQLLLQHNADIDICNLKGETPLYRAARHGLSDIARLLIKNHASVNRKTNNWTTPLYIAVQNGHAETVQILLENKAEINMCDAEGASALYVAAENGDNAIVEMLIDRKANINISKKNGWTPLHAAAYNGQCDTLERLILKRDADLNRCAANGESPLYCAAEKGHQSTVKLLLEHKADMHQQTNSGMSPSQIAKKNRYQTVVDLLELHEDLARERPKETTKTSEVHSVLIHNIIEPLLVLIVAIVGVALASYFIQ